MSIEHRFSSVSNSKTFKNLVRSFSLDQKAVLDIGCSYGEFLAHFGPGSAGVTISPEEMQYAVGRGLRVLCGNIESDEFSFGREFDVVFANNIFEHLYAPHAFLIKVKRYLKPGGILILGVPCIPGWHLLMRLNKFRGSLADAHINFFTKDSLALTVARGGWLVHEVRGFRLPKAVDWMLNPVYPHFYAIATPDQGFSYTPKRQRELAGYKDLPAQ